MEGILGRALVIAAQILTLAAFNYAGQACVQHLNLPLPGNLVGMLLLLTLLGLGVIPLRWLDAGASLLLSHLAFFFIPFAVGLISFAGVLKQHGVAWMVTLVIAAAAGILAAGILTQALAVRPRLRRP